MSSGMVLIISSGKGGSYIIQIKKKLNNIPSPKPIKKAEIEKFLIIFTL
jgi:hypothetical protein